MAFPNPHNDEYSTITSPMSYKYQSMNRKSVSQPVSPTEPNKLKAKFKTTMIDENIADSPPPPRGTSNNIQRIYNTFLHRRRSKQSSAFTENIMKPLSLIESRETSYSKDIPYVSSQDKNQNPLTHKSPSARSSPFIDRVSTPFPVTNNDHILLKPERKNSGKMKDIALKIKAGITRSNSNSMLVSFNKLRHDRGRTHSPASRSQYFTTDLVGYNANMEHTLTSDKSGTTISIPLRQRAKLLLKGKKKMRSDTLDIAQIKTTKEYNKNFIMQRLRQHAMEPLLYHRPRRSTVSKVPNVIMNVMTDNETNTMTSANSFSLDETEYQMVVERAKDYNYNDPYNKASKKASIASTNTQRTFAQNETTTLQGWNSRKQLVYIHGINDRNKYDVSDRLFDLFEMWGDEPDILWNNNCLYVRFPSIKSAIDGINVFDGAQPNGYSLSAELVLEGSQMVYIDGLDGDWNEEVFKNFVEIPMESKVSIKKISDNAAKTDKAYAFVQFQSLEAVQSAIDQFDAESEIDGKLVRWEHMIKAYVGKIGSDKTVEDIQNELSAFDASFKHLPIEIRKCKEPLYYKSNSKQNRSMNSSAIDVAPALSSPVPKATDIISNQIRVTSMSTIKSYGDTQSLSTPNNTTHQKQTLSMLVLSPKSESDSSSASIKEQVEENDGSPYNHGLPTIISSSEFSSMTSIGSIPSLPLTQTPKVKMSANKLNPMQENKEQIVAHKFLQQNISPITVIYDDIQRIRKQSVEEQKSATPVPLPQTALGLFGKQYSTNSNESLNNSMATPQPNSPKFSIVSSNNNSQSMGSDDVSDIDEEYEYEYEWHHYAYVWFFNKYDAMRAQTRFDHRNCFGSNDIPIRFLLMQDMTQKVYVSGLMKECTTKESIERDIAKHISDTDLWRKKCIVTYRNNEERPFAYLRFPSLESSHEAIQLFHHKICFGNERFSGRNKERIHLELVKEENELLCHHIARKWNAKKYWFLTLSFIFLPICLTLQWLMLCFKCNSMSATAKDLAPRDLLCALFCFNENIKQTLIHRNHLCRCSLIVISYLLYILFYHLLIIAVKDEVYTALLPILLYFVIAQLFCSWCAVDFEISYPQFHVLEHVSMYFEDPVLYSRIHVMASDFAAAKNWNQILYPCAYPIEWNKRMILPAVIYPLLSRFGAPPFRWIELLAALLMFCFCFTLFCVFNTITSRILCYWKEVLHITELITLKSNFDESNTSPMFLKLDTESNLFAWLSLRSFIHRKGCVVFCGLEMHSLFLVIIITVNLVTIIIALFEVSPSSWLEIENRLIFCQMWFLCVSIYYLCYVLLIGYWFGKENQNQLNRVERHKLFIYTERMKQVLNHEKYKLIDNTKIVHLKLLLNSMEALVQHIQTKEITPQLWGIKLNDFKWKVAMTVVAAAVPSVLVRWILNVN